MEALGQMAEEQSRNIFQPWQDFPGNSTGEGTFQEQ